MALALLCSFALIALKPLQWLRDKTTCLNLSIRLLAFHVRRYILVERITVTMKTMKIRFKQNILDTYLEQLCVLKVQDFSNNINSLQKYIRQIS